MQSARMVDRLDQVAARPGKTEGGPLEVDITTTDPDRRFRLSVSDAVVLHTFGRASGTRNPSSTAKAHMPAAALVRLAYGRLDRGTLPPQSRPTVELERLRSVFPGL